MANIWGAAGSAFGSAAGGGGSSDSSIFTPTTGAATASNQGITFGNTAKQSLAQNLPVILIGVAALVAAFALLRKK